MQGGINRVVCGRVPKDQRGCAADSIAQQQAGGHQAACRRGGCYHPLELSNVHDHPQSLPRHCCRLPRKACCHSCCILPRLSDALQQPEYTWSSLCHQHIVGIVLAALRC